MPVIDNPVGMTLDNIMVATDFTPASELATLYAGLMAKRFSSKLTLTHVVDLSVATKCDDAVVGISVADMRLKGARRMERSLSDLSDAGLAAHGETLEAHNPAAAVIELATEVAADLLIVGTHDRHGLEKMILGSASEGIIRHAHCPVMVVGPKVKVAKNSGLSFHKIVFATDLLHETAKKAAVALAFAKDSLAHIYVCHILKDTGKDFSEAIELELKAETALRRLIPESDFEWCGPECVVEAGDVGRHLVALAERVSADLIVMGAKRSSNWFTHISGGAVGYVVSNVACPVLTLCDA